MKRGVLLLIDDDRQVLASMADWLRQEGFEVRNYPSREQYRAFNGHVLVHFDRELRQNAKTRLFQTPAKVYDRSNRNFAFMLKQTPWRAQAAKFAKEGQETPETMIIFKLTGDEASAEHLDLINAEIFMILQGSGKYQLINAEDMAEELMMAPAESLTFCNEEPGCIADIGAAAHRVRVSIFKSPRIAPGTARCQRVRWDAPA